MRAMKILGISAFYHDAAAALIDGGDIVAAAQEERFTRRKHDPAFPANAIRYCLEASGTAFEELEAVAFYDKPFLKFERLLETYYAFAPRGLRSFLAAMPVWIKEKLFLKRLLLQELSLLAGHKVDEVEAALPRAPPLARRERVLPLALRGGGDPDDRRRRRVGDRVDLPRPGQRHRDPARAALPALGRPALLGVHLLPRASGSTPASTS